MCACHGVIHTRPLPRLFCFVYPKWNVKCCPPPPPPKGLCCCPPPAFCLFQHFQSLPSMMCERGAIFEGKKRKRGKKATSVLGKRVFAPIIFGAHFIVSQHLVRFCYFVELADFFTCQRYREFIQSENTF